MAMSDAGASGEPDPPGTQSLIPVTSMVTGLVDGSNLRGHESRHRQSHIGMGGNNDPGPSGSGLAMMGDAFYVRYQGGPGPVCSLCLMSRQDSMRVKHGAQSNMREHM